MSSRYLRRALSVVAALMTMLPSAATGQQPPPPDSHGGAIRGHVIDQAGRPVVGASVRLQQEGPPKPIGRETKTDSEGGFEFAVLSIGRYVLSAEQSPLNNHGSVVVEFSGGLRSDINLILAAPGDLPSNSNVVSPSASQAMEFSDKPNFTIAGVTDWTAVGGHGSDFTLRTSEDLARQTLALKPEASKQSGANAPSGVGEANQSESKLRAALTRAPDSFDGNRQLGEFYLHAGRFRDSIPLLEAAYHIDPTIDGNAYDLALAYKGAGDLSQARDQVRRLLARKNTADLHHLAGELDEKLGDPLAAVQEEEEAVRLDPSEQNYFEWGSELLLHRAVWQAVEVFKDGAKIYPRSPRMLTALGTALFAGAFYNDAALRLCDASDLNPADPVPYIFMGKIEIAAPAPLPCVEARLARFAQDQHENPLANYLYAMALWKRQEQPPDQRALQQVETLLTKAVTVDPKCGDAQLQLGILYSSRHNYQKAIDSYTKAIEVDPQLGEAHYRLGVEYDRLGEQAKAKKEFVLHDELEEQQAAAVERQRREIKQFLVVLQGQPASPAAH